MLGQGEKTWPEIRIDEYDPSGSNEIPDPLKNWIEINRTVNDLQVSGIRAVQSELVSGGCGGRYHGPKFWILPAQLSGQTECQEHFADAHRPDPGPGSPSDLLAQRG